MSDTPISPAIRFVLTFALAMAAFILVLDYSIANVSIPYIAGDLAVAADQGTYVITSFAVGNAIVLPITGWLTARLGLIRLISLSLVLFALFSWACGAAPDFQSLIVCRFLQGVVAGPAIPLSQTLLLMITPPEKKQGALATWSTIVITAPILGPIVGGWISYDYYWPWIFYINVPIALVSAALLWFYLKARETPREAKKLDTFSLIVLSIGVTSLQFLLDKGEQYDWWRSDLIVACGISAVICFTLLIVRSLTYRAPLIDLTLFKIRTYALSVFYIFVMYAVYFGSVVLIPLWLQTNMNYTSVWAGIAVAPLGIAAFIFGPFMGKAIEKLGPNMLLIPCFVIFACSCFYTAYFNTSVDLNHIALSRFFFGCAVVFFVTPLFALSVQDVPQERLASSTGIFHFVRALSGAIGTSIFTTLWTRRGALHHAFIGENVTEYSAQTSAYLSQLEQAGYSLESARALMNQTLTQEAMMMSINDCMFVMGWLFVFLLLFLPLSRSKQKKRGAAHAAPLVGE